MSVKAVRLADSSEHSRLTLTRERDQEILIGNDVRVRVVKIGTQKVRLSVQAPRKMRIFRAELRDRKQPTTETQRARRPQR